MELIKLRKNQVQIMSPPKFQMLMVGVKRVTITRQMLVTLLYTDDTEESATVTKDEWKDIDTFFGVVSTIQSKARSLTGHDNEKP